MIFKYIHISLLKNSIKINQQLNLTVDYLVRMPTLLYKYVYITMYKNNTFKNIFILMLEALKAIYYL